MLFATLHFDPEKIKSFKEETKKVSTIESGSRKQY